MDIDIYSSLGPWDSGILWGDPWNGVGGDWALLLAFGCIYLTCGQVLDAGTSIYSAPDTFIFTRANLFAFLFTPRFSIYHAPGIGKEDVGTALCTSVLPKGKRRIE